MDFKEFVLNEMPYGVLDDEGISIDFKLEKPYWNKRMLYFINRSQDKEELLKPFYTLSYGKILKKKFLELSDNDKAELRRVLPRKFIEDMEL